MKRDPLESKKCSSARFRTLQTYLLDNCLASSVYLRNLECGLSSLNPPEEAEEPAGGWGLGPALDPLAPLAELAVLPDAPLAPPVAGGPSLTKCILDRWCR